MSISDNRVGKSAINTLAVDRLTKRLLVHGKETTQQFREQSDSLSQTEKERLFKEKLKSEINRRSNYERFILEVDGLSKVFLISDVRSHEEITETQYRFYELIRQKQDLYDQQIFRRMSRRDSPSDIFTLVILNGDAMVFDDRRQIAYQFVH